MGKTPAPKKTPKALRIAPSPPQSPPTQDPPPIAPSERPKRTPKKKAMERYSPPPPSKKKGKSVMVEPPPTEQKKKGKAAEKPPPPSEKKKRKESTTAEVSPVAKKKKKQALGFDAGKFVSKNASDSFHKLFSVRPILMERILDIPTTYPGDDFASVEKAIACQEVLQHLSKRGWMPLLNLNLNGYPELVREFYANMEHEGTISFVRGQIISFSPENICRVLGVPHVGSDCDMAKFSNVIINRVVYSDILCEGNAQWLESKRPEQGARALVASSMSTKAKLWWMFVRGILLPITHHFSLTPIRLWCVRLLCEGRKVCAGLTIAQEMMALQEQPSKKAALSYAGIISLLCIDAGVDISGLEPTRPSRPMDMRSVFGEAPPKAGIEPEQERAASDGPHEREEEPEDPRNRITKEDLKILNRNLKKTFLQNKAILMMQPLLRQWGRMNGVDVSPFRYPEELTVEQIKNLCHFEEAEPEDSTSTESDHGFRFARREGSSSQAQNLDRVVNMASNLGGQTSGFAHTSPVTPVSPAPLVKEKEPTQTEPSGGSVARKELFVVSVVDPSPPALNIIPPVSFTPPLLPIPPVAPLAIVCTTSNEPAKPPSPPSSQLPQITPSPSPPRTSPPPTPPLPPSPPTSPHSSPLLTLATASISTSAEIAQSQQDITPPPLTTDTIPPPRPDDTTEGTTTADLSSEDKPLPTP